MPSGGSGGGGTSLHAGAALRVPPAAAWWATCSTRAAARGEQWEKQGRSGTLKFTELITEYLDEHDEVVITARTVAVLTEGPK